MLRLPNQVGSLVKTIAPFEKFGVNLTWIESFPAQTGKQEYLFFVDFEGHQDDPKIAKPIKALGEHCSELTILGSFALAKTVAE
jgi:chorismate mutase/prephenate dehydratase